MSTNVVAGDAEGSREIRYEVSASKDVVTLTIETDGGALSVSTKPRSASLLASDLLTAVDHSTETGRHGGDGFGVDP